MNEGQSEGSPKDIIKRTDITPAKKPAAEIDHLDRLQSDAQRTISTRDLTPHGKSSSHS